MGRVDRRVPTRILLTHDRFPPDFAGGGEYIVGRTALNLARMGIAVRVVTTGDPALAAYEGIPTVRLPIHRYRFNLALRPLVEHARDADLIQTFTYHACLPSLRAGRRLGLPVVCGVLGLFHKTWKELRPPLLAQAWIAWERFLLTRPYARVVFLSEASRDLGLRLGVSPLRAKVCPPGVDLDRLAPEEPKEDLALFVGKFEARKGILDVLAAARALPHVRFRAVGWGPEEATLRSSALPNLEILPFLSGDPLRREFGRASLFVFPSRAETFGLVVAEAMASGCAVISSLPLDFEGIRIPPADLRALIEAVRTLWSRPEEVRRMGRMNQEAAMRYSWERSTTRLLEIYDEVFRDARP